MPRMHSDSVKSGTKFTFEDQIRHGIHRLVGQDFSNAELVDWLSSVMESHAALEFVKRSTHWREAPAIDLAQADGCFSPGYRKEKGLYFTPHELADRVVSHLDRLDGIIVDLSCGAGALLVSALNRGARGVRGVEQELGLAAASAARLVFLFPDRDVVVIWGDGLQSYAFEEVVGVVGNPPYVGEKGNGTFFRGLRETHSDLAEFFRPRMDLAYLFMVRSVQVARGARVVLLTSEYWLQADGADRVRDVISRHAPVQVLDFLGAENFSDAPGHHSLIFAGGGRLTGPVLATGKEPWPRVHSLHKGVLLGELAQDRQGFVSGLDRFESRAVFLFREGEVAPGIGKIRPVLRGMDCVPNRIFLENPSDHQVVWLDDRVLASEERISELLGFARSKLETRRECMEGKIPWYRLHWPRRRAEMVLPKLVVPRRAQTPQFALDLSASAVSSDCSYLLAPPDEVDPVAFLVGLMWVLNSSATQGWLNDWGKRKGKLYEFYATPLRMIPVDRLPEMMTRAKEILLALDPCDGPFVDISLD